MNRDMRPPCNGKEVMFVSKLVCIVFVACIACCDIRCTITLEGKPASGHLIIEVHVLHVAVQFCLQAVEQNSCSLVCSCTAA
jgi:hypothetical protein